MHDPKLLSMAMDVRARAEEVLVRADTFHDALAKQQMRQIAVKYEKLAERLEHAAAD